jgi:hypothetical protein
LFQWFRKNIRFVRDADGVELLRAPRETLTIGMGDCDDQTMLICALLKTIGQRVRIVTVATHPQAPEQFSHVFAEVRDERGRWIPLDTARKAPRYGLGPNHWYRRWHWDPDTAEYCDASCGDCDPGISGLGYYLPNVFPLPTTGQGPFLLAPGLTARPQAAGGLSAYDPRARYLTGLGAGSRTTRRKRRRMMGQSLEDDISAIAPSIPSILTGTANIITASRANPLNLVPYTGATTSTSSSGLTPAAQVAITEAQLAANPLASISPTTLLLIGGGALALLLVMSKKSQ